MPKEDKGLIVLHTEITNGFSLICSEAKSENLWLNNTDPSSEQIIVSCD